ncbi:uncharacterized protein LOC114524439 [Dendronephthya gigantea]|uniref:uncharacterized protein LOC114524439 n=1 Tax=Dendronephthya gigantea TaxID=151771 RepID=UPI00106D4DA5|nr:uncharacterized protein LOC114524439 [Dendronephthya gigantea]
MENANNEEAQSKYHSFEAKVGPVRISINPVVTILSALIIWGFVIICMIMPSDAMNAMNSAKSWITTTSTWFYVGTKNIWLVFVLFILFSKHSKTKLGKDDDEPEFSDMTYFTMLFAAGVGIGLFYFGVAEPVIHYETHMPYANRYWGRYNDNQRSRDAMNITLFHWGLHAWVVYVIVGLLLAYVGHRHGQPMTVRSCFYPLLGDQVNGIAGDLIDTVSVVGTMFGVCTSLGLGVITLNSGLHRLISSIEDENQTARIIIIWVITAMATISVVSGLKVGIRRLSEICFGLGMFLMLFVFFRGGTWYYLNVYVQGIGYYLQYAIEVSFHTDAYAQEGNAPDGKESPTWMKDWTIFYWGWWISWSPYIGMFIAKISRGRTIRNYLMCTMTAPILYTFLWFSIFGGAGLNLEREAALAGINCSSPLGGKLANEPYDGMYRLSCRTSAQMFFDLMQSFNDRLTPFLHVVSLVSITLYFVTSSDSGSLVIDCLSANGSDNPPVIQRVFWAVTEGACATGLLLAGGTDALNALQTVSVAAGLPYTVIVCFMCVALWEAISTDKKPEKKSNAFLTGLFHVFTFPLSSQKLLDFAIALTIPWFPAGRASTKPGGRKISTQMISLAVLFYSFIILLILKKVENDIIYFGWVVLMGYFAFVTAIRANIRQTYKIDGNMVLDFLVVMFLHPFAVDQMDRQVLYERAKKDDENFGAELEDLRRYEVEIEERETFIKKS